jgi:superkiller protein 3
MDCQYWHMKKVCIACSDFSKFKRKEKRIVHKQMNEKLAMYRDLKKLKKLGRYEEALQAIDKALELNPDNSYAWNNKGIALRNLGRHEEALQAYDKALELNPDYSNAWYNKGIALYNLGRHEEAQRASKKASELNMKTK